MKGKSLLFSNKKAPNKVSISPELYRNMLLSMATTIEVKKLIEQLYRPGATIGDGGTAAALRHENDSGENVGNKSHRIKAEQRANQIRKILSKSPDHPDKKLLQNLLDDLEDALKGDKK